MDKYILKRLDTIDGKIDDLIKFKWQIIGGSMMFSGVLAMGVQILFKVLEKT